MVKFPTGHFHIKNTLKQTNAPLAGEMSGHIFFNDKWHGFDDGHYSAFRLLEIMNDLNIPLSTILDQLPKALSTPELNINIEEEKKFEIVKNFVDKAQFEITDIKQYITSVIYIFDICDICVILC